jgi:hypothetical protein
MAWDGETDVPFKVSFIESAGQGPQVLSTLEPGSFCPYLSATLVSMSNTQTRSCRPVNGDTLLLNTMQEVLANHGHAV